MFCYNCTKSFPKHIGGYCSLCQLIYYCSEKCMNEDWNNHKYVCDEFIYNKNCDNII